MAFRANEAAEAGFEQMLKTMIPRGVSTQERASLQLELRSIEEELGPVITSYPAWHPLVCHHNPMEPVTFPSERCGYRGLDHTIAFVNGFITCPYNDGQQVIDSVEALPRHPSGAIITATRLDLPLYSESATPILVKCEWGEQHEACHTIPLFMATPLLLNQELSTWGRGDFAETWETMKPYFLGEPHGKLSSLFVTQNTGQVLKKIWEQLINTGMFGPIKE
ncbi:hypothetical protein ACTG16_23290 [Aeromonas sp. 23P]|uniref:hypothetical protein n=1 Tax=Aeromonas sp. 23P TaxID=3452716 RepID=UPI003F794E44|nr:hypothetical protein [Aeromonas veronii]